jgi:hypothetical protein
VNYTIEDGSATDADNDYEPASGQLSFGPTDTTESVQVTVNGDTKFEPDEAEALESRGRDGLGRHRGRHDH